MISSSFLLLPDYIVSFSLLNPQKSKYETRWCIYETFLRRNILKGDLEPAFSFIIRTIEFVLQQRVGSGTGCRNELISMTGTFFLTTSRVLGKRSIQASFQGAFQTTASGLLACLQGAWAVLGHRAGLWWQAWGPNSWSRKCLGQLPLWCPALCQGTAITGAQTEHCSQESSPGI